MTQPPIHQMGESWSTLITSGDMPQELRLKGIDEGTRLHFLTRDISKFSHFIHTRFPKTRKVSDRVYRVMEMDEFDRYYTVKIASADDYHKKFGLSNAQAAQIQPQDILFCKNIFATIKYEDMVAGQVYPASGGTQGTNIGPDLGYDVGGNPTEVLYSRTKGPDDNGEYFTDYEQIKVTQVEKPDSAGDGYAYVHVERYYAGPHSQDKGGKLVNRALVNTGITTYVTDAAFQVGDILLRGTPTFLEGTQAPNGVYKNPESDNNFTQEFKYAAEKTRESDIPKLNIKMKPMDINKHLVSRRMNRDIDVAMLFNKKGMTSRAGKEEYIVGGVHEFIIKDPLHYLIYQGNSLSWPGWLDMGKSIFGLGGGEERVIWTSITVDAELRKMFYNDQHMRFNPSMSQKFNMEVNSIVVSGGTLHIIPMQIMEESGFESEMICLDMTKPDAFEPVTNEGWDMFVDKGPNGRGIQEPGVMIYKEQIIGMKGLMRRYRPYHCIIDLSTVI